MDMHPKANNLLIPVYIPNDEGDDGWQIGEATLKHDTLKVKFGNSVAALAVEHAIARGELIGLAIVKIVDPAEAVVDAPVTEAPTDA